MLLKSTIFPEPFITFYTEILSLVILALSCSVISKTLGLNTQQSVFFSILYSALPQFAYQLEFSNQSDTLATAVLLSSVSTYLTLRKKGFLLSIITPVIALTFSVSIYQSIIFLPVSIIASYICYAIANNKSDLTFKNIVFKPVIVMIVAAVAYSLLTKIIQWHFGKSSESYFLNMIGWIHQPVNETIKSIVAFIIDYFSFNAPYGLSIYAFSLLFLVVIFVSPLKTALFFCFQQPL